MKFIIINIIFAIILALISFADGVSFRKQVEHVRKTKKQSLAFSESDPSLNQSRKNEGMVTAVYYNNMILPLPHRRFFPNSGYTSVVLGGPSVPGHLPAAEPILPGHTLIRPSLSMLKSAVKFPHKDLENGAGVYGHIDNLGIKYDGLNDRVLYTGFRRMPSDYVMIVPVKSKTDSVPKAIVTPVVLDLDNRPNSIDLKRGLINDETKQSRSIYTANFDYMDNGIMNVRASELERPKRNVLRQGANDDISVKKLVRARHEQFASDEYDASFSEEKLYVEPEVLLFEEDQAKKKIINKKRQWFWDSKNAYNYVKISSNAPEYTDITPHKNLNNLRQWWFYHQEDFEPFDNHH